ncbi:15-hydroxyprostaglandin dehydrogenase (NAD) [Entomortierella parvispora]|uniref:15-hydroxyprostaglandin dehydrogenase (NAD) n=1 Tax=Entomortierella parvispora TaxID=205924 RepID=A0A9P3H9R6_9FUNG|nr:15-hydroxyprostaglandin dehydrogenase (NAD) [Entomortierella parvispora]
MLVQDKVAIITGASSGFGKALAQRLTSKGAKVILGDIDVKDGERLANELNYDKKEKIAYFVQCDVTNYAQQAALFDAAQRHFGRIDIIINNAGIAESVPLWQDDKALWKKVIDIDLSAVIEGTRLGIEALQKQGTGGAIVNTASLAGLYPQTMTPAYSAAKFGVVGLTRSFKGFGDNIRVNAVAPSFADTKIIANVRDVVASLAPLVPVETVIDAFMMLIEDESFSGDIARITPQYGISIIGRSSKAKL